MNRAKSTPRLSTYLPFFIIAGVVLSTLHQSSLGTLMLLANWRLHPLWNSPLVPSIFLLSFVEAPPGYSTCITTYVPPSAFVHMMTREVVAITFQRCTRMGRMERACPILLSFTRTVPADAAMDGWCARASAMACCRSICSPFMIGPCARAGDAGGRPIKMARLKTAGSNVPKKVLFMGDTSRGA